MQILCSFYARNVQKDISMSVQCTGYQELKPSGEFSSNKGEVTYREMLNSKNEHLETAIQCHTLLQSLGLKSVFGVSGLMPHWQDSQDSVYS